LDADDRSWSSGTAAVGAASKAVQFGQASSCELSQTIKLCELVLGSCYLGVKVDGHGAILNTVPV